MEPTRKITFMHRIEYAAYLGVEALLGCCSISRVVSLGRIFGSLLYRVSSKHRHIVARNLRILLAEKSLDEEQLREVAKETFRRAGANLLASLRTATMTRDELENSLSIEGEEHLWAALEQKKGVVLVCAHMGNWEMLAQMLDLYRGKLQGGSMYRTMRNRLLEQLIFERRSQRGGLMFSRQQGYIGALKALRENAVIAVLSDQRAGMSGECVPFFGKLASCAPLPSLMARRVGAQILSLSIRSTARGKWSIRMRPIPENSRTPEIMSALELALRDQIEDGFWFQDRWRCDPDTPMQVTRDHPLDYPENASLPLRILVAPPREPEAAHALLQGILELRPDAEISLLVDSSAASTTPFSSRVTPYVWEESANSPTTEALVKEIDQAHAIPIDFAILPERARNVARACHALGINSIIGVGNSLVDQAPWTAIHSEPNSPQAWQKFPEQLIQCKTPHNDKLNAPEHE